jgi:hypothetical protein
VHVETAVTDDQGRYATPWWWQKPPLLANSGPVSDAYLAAYEPTREGRPQGASEKDVYMKRFVGTAGERFEFISGRVFSGLNCHSGTPSERNLVALLIPAYIEARGVASPDEWRAVHGGLRESIADSWLARSNDVPYMENKFEYLPGDIKAVLQ